MIISSISLTSHMVCGVWSESTVMKQKYIKLILFKPRSSSDAQCLLFPSGLGSLLWCDPASVTLRATVTFTLQSFSSSLCIQVINLILHPLQVPPGADPCPSMPHPWCFTCSIVAIWSTLDYFPSHFHVDYMVRNGWNTQIKSSVINVIFIKEL